MASTLNSTPRIALILDNPLRDLPGLSLLALELSSRGCRVFIVPMYLNDEVFSLAPDFVLLNYLRKVSKGVAQALAGNRIPFGVLDTEGGPTQDADGLYVSYWCDDVILTRTAARVCAWGPETASALEKSDRFKKESITVTGQPRFDIYGEPWRRISARMAPHVNKIKGPFVLVCSNFGFTSSQYGDRHQVAKSMTELYGTEENVIRDWQEEEDLAIEQMVECVLKLAEKFPQYQIVYRPHPFEKIQFYEEKFSSRPNIVLNKEGDVSAWMIAAKAVLQLNCTTCYDAWFAKTPSLKPGWIRQKSGIGEEIAINEICETFEILEARLAGIFAGDVVSVPESSPKTLALVQRFFGTPDGKAYVRVADAILKSLDQQGRAGRLKNLRSVKRSARRELASGTSLLTRLKTFIFSKLGFQSTWRISTLAHRKELVERYLNSGKYFSADLVKNWVQALAEARGGEIPRVSWAVEGKHYPFGGRYGKTVVIEPVAEYK